MGIRWLSGVLLLALSVEVSLAEQGNGKSLRVGLFIEDPFVTKTANGYAGFCVDLWSRIMEMQNWQCSYSVYPSANQVLEGIKKGEVDVGVGPFYITSERLKTLDFTHPYHESGLQLMINTNRQHTLRKLWDGLVEGGHLKILMTGAAIILILTHLLLFFERKMTPDYTKKYFDGFADCFYEVMSVAMSGKISHKGLPGPWGKLFAALWLAGGVAVVAYITSTITSVMTANKIRGAVHGISDLAGQPVGVIAGTVSEKAAEKYNFVGVSYPNLTSAADDLVKRRISAIAFDTFVLRYFDRMHPELPVGEVGAVFEKGAICFTLPQGSPIRNSINESIVKIKENGEMQTLDNKFFETVGN